MKLSVFDHVLNQGGGLRYLTSLLISIKKQRPEFEITLYCDIRKLREHESYDLLEKSGIQICSITMPILSIKRKAHFLCFFIYNLIFKGKVVFTNPFHMKYLLKSIERVAPIYDLAFFSWPYYIELPKIGSPIVAIFHDFNYKYFFGMPIFDRLTTKILNENIEIWLQHCIPVVSNNFMHSELKKFYPETGHVHVVHLPSINPIFSSHDSVLDQDIIPNEYGEYILCSSHMVTHKNIGNLISSLYLVNQERVDKIKMIITGGGTEMINGKSGYLSLEPADKKDADVIGMGYVSNEKHNSFILNSIAVINASFYEAGNGIGLDAWQMGVPVIQSSIPAFREHLNLQGYKAIEFDPRDPMSIANAITLAINDKKLCESNVNESLKAAQSNNWELAAGKYISIFEEAIK